MLRRWTRVALAAGACVTVLAACVNGGANTNQPDRPAVSMDVVATRAAHTSTSLDDGRVFVAGGCVSDGCAVASDDTALVEADGRHARRGPDLSEPRTSHTATPLADGRVVIVGGFLGEGAGVTVAIDTFDPATGEVELSGSLAVPRGGHAAARLPDDRILVVGGWVASGRYTDVVELFDPRTGELSAGDSLPWAADGLEATSLPDGQVLVTGGQVAPGEATSSAAVYDPQTGRWQTIPPMSSPRFKHFAVLLDDGRVLIGGGTPDDHHLLSSTEVFDYRTGAFVTGPQLLEGRYKLPGGAIALPGGRALLAGGGLTVELVEVSAGSSRHLVRLEARASFATVNLLSDDSALILGGYDDRIDLTGMRELIGVPLQR